MLFTTLCTGCILKIRTRKLVFLQHSSKFRMSDMQHFIQKTQVSKVSKLHGPASILEYQKNIKLRRKRSHTKDTGKSSSRKLRQAVYYLLYRMDPQKTLYKISFSTKMSNIQNSGFLFYFPPSKGPLKGPLKGPHSYVRCTVPCSDDGT